MRTGRPKNDRVGETCMMECGLQATITRYGKYNDIDVVFEDGQVRCHKTYYNFTKGKILPPVDPRKVSHVGEKRKMNCGLVGELIRYGGNKDIDVLFEDGQKSYNKSYNEFLNGSIAPPVDPRYSHVGEKKVMNCGLEATVTRYGAYKDIDVRFEDGQEVCHRSYHSFLRGSITPPKDPRRYHVGEKRRMNCGLIAEITRFGRCDDIDVCFEDGQKVTNRTYEAFIRGSIMPPISPSVKERIGEEKMMACGLMAKIVEYNACKDVSIMFQDGKKVSGRDYWAFQKGTVMHPDVVRGFSNNFYGYKIQIAFRMGNKVYYRCEKGDTRNIMTLQDMVVVSGRKLVF